MADFEAAFSAPLLPSQVSREALSSDTIAMMTLAPAAASAGLDAMRAPSAAKGRAFIIVRL
jgi:hypothetical protein